jgi:hypothetical protein
MKECIILITIIVSSCFYVNHNVSGMIPSPSSGKNLLSSAHSIHLVSISAILNGPSWVGFYLNTETESSFQDAVF